MHFAVTLPSWGLVGLALAPFLVAWWTYTRLLVPLSPTRRAVLVALRTAALALVIVCLLRPVRLIPPIEDRDVVVPVLVDRSRSMRIVDQGGEARIDAARDLVDGELAAALSRFTVEKWSFGDGLTRLDGELTADASQSDLAGALRALRDRYRDRRVAGIVVVSDGGETGARDAATTIADQSTPIFTVGLGSPALASDLEVLDVSAGETAVSESSVDLTVSAVSRARVDGFDVRLLENGRAIDLKRVVPSADGSPSRITFTVEPPGEGAALYTVQIPLAEGELVVENNRRSLLLEPPIRSRRLLTVEGAPAFEHTFVKRALASDAGLEIDAIVRKGRDAQGAATFFLQGESERVVSLSSGFPADAAALSQYDAIVLANIEADTLSRQQLGMVANFVGQRGGGLLVLGARSFDRQTFANTPLEDVLPLKLTDRASGVVRDAPAPASQLRVAVTEEGLRQPVMRIGQDEADTARRWQAFPALAGVAALGALKPGAAMLAVAATPDGLRPLVAVQRYGQGRALVFTGEASWRWRMQLPSADRSFELFWRQAARWVASGARDRVTVLPPVSPVPGTPVVLASEVRDATFSPVRDATVTFTVTPPTGDEQKLAATLADADTGQYAAQFTFGAGVYRIRSEARRGGVTIGTASAWSLAGAVDREMSDPRLNEEVLRRLSRASGGQYVPAADVGRLAPLLQDRLPGALPGRVEDVWDRTWVFALAVALLALEWGLRRAWGLR